MSFSERMGLTQVKSVIQIDSIDDELLNGLWNVLMENYFSNEARNRAYLDVQELLKRIWIDYFKAPIDVISFESHIPIEVIRKYFFDKQTNWYEIYDLVEFIPNNYQQYSFVNDKFINQCNSILEREVSAYRFVANEIVQITTPEEITEIEEAINNHRTSDLVKTHLSNALKHLAERKLPDYRTSIKESISAVECIVKAIDGDPKTTLGAALNKIKTRGSIDIHPDLYDGLKKIYHYTSDSDGIRHALKDASTVDFEDAKFMLVMCSTFCNYLTAKSNKAGISIN